MSDSFIMTGPDIDYTVRPKIMLVDFHKDQLFQIHDIVTAQPKSITIYLYNQGESTVEWACVAAQAASAILVNLSNDTPDDSLIKGHLLSTTKSTAYGSDRAKFCPTTTYDINAWLRQVLIDI